MLYISYEKRLAIKRFLQKTRMKIKYLIDHRPTFGQVLFWMLFSTLLSIILIVSGKLGYDYYKKLKGDAVTPIAKEDYRVISVEDLHSIDLTTLRIKVSLDTLVFPEIKQISDLADNIYKDDGHGWESVIISFYLYGMDKDLNPYVLTEYRNGKQKMMKVDHTHSIGVYMTEYK